MDAITPPGDATAAMPITDGAPGENRGLVLIALFALVKGILFLIVAVGVFHAVNRDTQEEMKRLLHAFRLSGDSTFLKDLLLKAKVITDPGKRILSGVLLLYAVLYTIEGTGLLLRRRWAEYFTAAMTAIPLPFEIYVLVHHTTHPELTEVVPTARHLPGMFSSHVFILKMAALVINVAILWYLIYHLRRSARHHTSAAAG